MTNHVAENIRRIREEKAWTQMHLAEAARVTERTIQRAESGKPIQAESLQAIAGALNVDHAKLSEDPLAEQKKAADARYEVIRLEKLTNAAQIGRLLPAHALMFSFLVDAPTTEQGDHVAALQQWLSDAIDIWRDLGPLEQHNLAKELQSAIDDLKAFDLVVAAGAHRVPLKLASNGQKLVWDFLVVSISASTEPKMFALWDKQQPINF
jgi:transcriptional regulator with XRE-family HTH domain